MHIVDLQDKSTDAEPRWKAETNGLMRGFQYCAPDRREEGNKRCFCLSVRPSIHLSVAYIANNSRTQRPSMHIFGRKVPHLR